MKEYRVNAADDDAPAINVASSSVVLRLQVPSAGTAAAKAAHGPAFESANYEREFLNYKPGVTLPYAYTEDDTFSAKPQEVFDSSSNAEDAAEDEAASDGDIARDPPTSCDPGAPPAKDGHQEDTTYAVRVATVLHDFESKSNEGDWPMTTSVSCYWCSHGFDTPPIGIPVRPFPSGEGFYVTGCFCSIPCAAAFNLESRDSHTNVCEKNSMLCELSRLVHGRSAPVRPAPDWKALQKFGGHLTIEQFRSFGDTGNVVLTNVPPMRSITTQLEEVNENNVGSGYNYVPLDPVRVERGIQELSLKRQKPRFDYKNSLSHKMNVVIRS